MATRQTGSNVRQNRRSSKARTGRRRGASLSAERARTDARSNVPLEGKQTRGAEQRKDLVYGVPVPKGLHQAIETERCNLAKVESLLGCLAVSIEYGDDTSSGPYLPDVAEIARDLVRKSLDALDALALQRHLLRNKVREGGDLLPGTAYPILGRNTRTTINAEKCRCLPFVAADAGRCLPFVAADAGRCLPSAAADAGRCLPSAAADAGRCLPSAATDADVCVYAPSTTARTTLESSGYH